MEMIDVIRPGVPGEPEQLEATRARLAELLQLELSTLRRLLRICARYGARPTIVLGISQTIMAALSTIWSCGSSR